MSVKISGSKYAAMYGPTVGDMRTTARLWR